MFSSSSRRVKWRLSERRGASELSLAKLAIYGGLQKSGPSFWGFFVIGKVWGMFVGLREGTRS